MVDGKDGVVGAWHRGDDAGTGRHAGAKPLDAGDQAVRIPVIACDVVIVGRRHDLHPHGVGVGRNAADQRVPCMAMGVNEAGNDEFSPAIYDLLVGVTWRQLRCCTDVDNTVALNGKATILDDASFAIHRHHRAVQQQKIPHFVLSLIEA
ncbi:hypothetical protein D3C72_1857120 [compost metagenome]